MSNYNISQSILLKTVYMFLFTVCLAGFVNAQTQEEAAEEGSEEKKPVVPKEKLEEYKKLSEELAVNYDTLMNLTDEETKRVQDLNYDYWVNTHFERKKLDSLKLEMQNLNRSIRQKERVKKSEIRKMAGKDKAKMEGLKKARQAERNHLGGKGANGDVRSFNKSGRTNFNGKQTAPKRNQTKVEPAK